MDRCWWLILVSLAAGCFPEEPTDARTPGYRVGRRVDEHGMRHDRIAFRGNPLDPQNPYANPGDLLSLSERILAQEDRRLPAAQETRVGTAPATAATSSGSTPARETLEARRERVFSMIRTPDLQRQREAAAILADPIDPLSPLAAVALGRMGDAASEQALEQALKDRRATVREAAILVLASMHAKSAPAHCRRLLRSDPMVAVRGAAAHGLGVLRVEAAREELRAALEHENPLLHIPIAWALARVNDPEGLTVLRAAALAEDSQVSPAAVRALASISQIEAVTILYQALFSHKEWIRTTALAALEERTAEERKRALAGFEPRDQARAEGRRETLLCLAGTGEVPASALPLLGHGSAGERALSLRCLAAAGTIRHVPPAITALGDEAPAVQSEARRALAGLVKRHNLKFPPGEDGTREEWQVWWFRLHRLVSCQAQSAVVLFPDGKQHTVRPGTLLHWDSPVVRIRPGRAPRDLQGACVEILCDRRPVRIDIPAEFSSP